MYDIGYEDDELIGYDELIGEDDYDDEDDDLAALLGARRRRSTRGRRRSIARPSRSALAIAKAVKRVDDGTILRKTSPTKSREFPIGFDSGAVLIAAAATATLTQRPQIIFRPERIVVPAAVAAFFLITDVKVGKNSQFVSAGSVPAATFSEGAFGVRLKMDTCQVSQDLIIDVTNFDVAAHRFMASMIGESVE